MDTPESKNAYLHRWLLMQGLKDTQTHTHTHTDKNIPFRVRVGITKAKQLQKVIVVRPRHKSQIENAASVRASCVLHLLVKSHICINRQSVRYFYVSIPASGLLMHVTSLR